MKNRGKVLSAITFCQYNQKQELRIWLFVSHVFIVSDPYSFDTDPEPDPHFRLNTDPNSGF